MSEERMIINALGGALVIAMFTLVLLIIPEKREERISQQELYCEMVALSIETNGEFGWPDFRNAYRKVCVA